MLKQILTYASIGFAILIMVVTAQLHMGIDKPINKHAYAYKPWDERTESEKMELAKIIADRGHLNLNSVRQDLDDPTYWENNFVDYSTQQD